MITKRRYHTKTTMPQGGSDAYQMLPRSMLAVRNPLVFLDWSTNAYHLIDLGLNQPCETFTNHYHREEGLGMTERYAGLELVVGGAVDEGDVMLFFIG